MKVQCDLGQVGLVLLCRLGNGGRGPGSGCRGKAPGPLAGAGPGGSGLRGSGRPARILVRSSWFSRSRLASALPPAAFT